MSVAELPELQIAVVYGFEQAVDAPHRMLRLSIDYGNGRDPLQDPGTEQYYCPQLLPSFSAELAGVALSIDNPGG